MPAPALGKVFLIGDSTSYRLSGQWEAEDGGSPTYNFWNSEHPDWIIDAVGGRNVNKLTERIQYHLANVDSSPSIFIMALGTNPDPEDDWWKWKYEQALNLLPATTKVVLVIPVRAGSNKNAKGAQVTKYAGWLHEIAAERNNTIVANWRNRALTNPVPDPVTGISSLLTEGIHQTHPLGRRTWLTIVETAVNRF